MGTGSGESHGENATVTERVYVSCLDKRHAFQTATAAAQAGMLDTFVTGAYYDRRALRYRWLPPVSGADTLRSVAHDAVLGQPRFLVPGKGLSRLPGVGRTIVPSVAFLAGEIAFDSFVARSYQGTSHIFHGFGRYSPRSLARARELGTLAVLDAFELHPVVELQREAEQRDRMSLGAPRVSSIRRRSIERRIEAYEHADVIFACLEDVKDSLVAQGISSERIRVIPLGADVVKGGPAPAPAGDSRPFRLLHVGPLHWFKGLHLLLDAWERLQLPHAELIIVGRPFAGWTDYFKGRLATVPQVRWVDGMEHEELLRYYGEVDAFAFPSLVGPGMVVYEAMAHGLPVIVSSGGVVRNGLDGLVVPADGSDKLDEAILTLYREPELRRHLGAEARSRVTEFTWNRYHAGVVREYKAALSAPKRRQAGSTGVE